MSTTALVLLSWITIDAVLVAGFSAIKLIGTAREREIYPPIRGTDWYSGVR